MHWSGYYEVEKNIDIRFSFAGNSSFGVASKSESEYVITVEILFDTGEKVSVPFGLKIKEGVWKVVEAF